MTKMLKVTENWWQTVPGLLLYTKEKQALKRILERNHAHVTLQVGVAYPCWVDPKQKNIGYLLSEAINVAHSVQADLTQWPIEPDSIELILLPHVLSQFNDPSAVIAEASMVLKPGGQLVVIDYNRSSIWRWCHVLSSLSVYFHARSTIRDRFFAAGLQVVKQQAVCFLPPLRNTVLSQRLQFLEALGQRIFPSFGAAYIWVLEKKVVEPDIISVAAKKRKPVWLVSKAGIASFFKSKNYGK